MSKCNCWIGILNSYDQSDTNNLYLDSYKEVLKRQSDHTKDMNKISPRHWKKFEPKDYLDRRRGMATLFAFCPWCGKRFNWAEIRKGVVE